MVVKVAELYSGIGGMHQALQGCCFDTTVAFAIDINPSANAVYRHNHPQTCLLERNIQSLSKEHFKDIDLITMSPPCQPFTRLGLKKDIEDKRTDSLLYIIDLLPHLQNVKYVLVENVKGFENSEARQLLTQSLNNSGFSLQEFLLSPFQFGIPNSRSRYYLLATKNKFAFTTSNKICEEIVEDFKLLKFKNNLKPLIENDQCFQISGCLDIQSNNDFLIPTKLLNKYLAVLDVVTPESRQSCCFTKGYTRFLEGTGSVLFPNSNNKFLVVSGNIKKLDKNSDEYLKYLESLELRYFTPVEIARLMGFSEEFSFPETSSNKQKYKLLGNSVNVYVVSVLLSMLLKE